MNNKTKSYFKNKSYLMRKGKLTKKDMEEIRKAYRMPWFRNNAHSIYSLRNKSYATNSGIDGEKEF
jgi:hypothetical protein